MTYAINVLISKVFYCILLIIISDAIKLCIKNFFVDKIKFCGTFKSTLTPMFYTSFSVFPPLGRKYAPGFIPAGTFWPRINEYSLNKH